MEEEENGDVFDSPEPENAALDNMLPIEKKIEPDHEAKSEEKITKHSKYSDTLQHLKPFRCQKCPEDELPLMSAGLFSLLTYSWLSPLMWKIYRKGVQCLDNIKCGHAESAEVNTERFERLWKEELSKRGTKEASIGRVVLRALRTRLVFSVMAIVAAVSFSFCSSAFILHRVLESLSSEEINVQYSVLLVFGLTMLQFGRSLLFSVGWMLNYQSGVRVRSALLGLMFKKVLHLRGMKGLQIGELVNLCSNDGQRLFEACAIGPLLAGGPVVLVFGVVYTVFLIGPWALIASLTFLAFYPLLALISRLTAFFRKKCIEVTDKRVRMMNELLTSIKLIKMYAWEDPFSKTVCGIRATERGVLEKGSYIQSISSSMAPMVPVMAAVFTFLGYILTGNDLDAATGFTVLAVLYEMRFSMGVMPYGIKAVAEARVAFARYKNVLLMEDVLEIPSEGSDSPYAIVLENVTMAWDATVAPDADTSTVITDVGNITQIDGATPEKKKLLGQKNGQNSDTSDLVPVLFDITFTLEKGQLCGVCGSVGCGKSSLISAILGRMVKISGDISLTGQVAYVSQQPWIINATARENILFGNEYSELRYNAVVRACSLEEDFDMFVDGDNTEVCDRGINLSGGQKQRISFARAIYSDNEVYILDDPLSAVDIHAGRHIFRQCIKQLLEGKTVLFITHQLQYLSQCDSVIFMKEGRITEQGHHRDLMDMDGEYASLIKIYYQEQDDDDLDEELLGIITVTMVTLLGRSRAFSSSSMFSGGRRGWGIDRQFSTMSTVSTVSAELTNTGRLVVAEEKDEGRVLARIYQDYISSAGGYFLVSVVLLIFVLSIGLQSASSWWLSHWLNQGSGNTTIQVNNMTFVSDSIQDNPQLQTYAMVYGLGLVLMIIFTAFRALVFTKITLHASSNIHDRMFNRVLSSTMSFFDETPVGRIINRFSADMDEIDSRLPFSLDIFLQNILLVISSFIVIGCVSPWFLIALVPLLVFFLILNIIFTSGVRELKRVDANTRSPLLSHVTASVQGISTIHAYRKSKDFLKQYFKLLDKNTVPFMLFYCSNRWLAVRLDLISNVVIAVTGILVVFTRDQIPPAMAGLAMAFAIQTTGLFQFTVRMAIDTESRFISVQRLKHYTEDIDQEPENVEGELPEKWPTRGRIVFQRLKMRYRDKLPNALRGVSFVAHAEERIGIVGKSGSGKSSLGVALFRLVNPSYGSISIDNIDISKVPLKKLRSSLSIIPQDPVLFVGTVRYNLDPFDNYTDEELWSALGKCHIKDTIAALDLKLLSPVVENGDNFSIGEKQLLCLARALLRKCKIMVLDEATASIDTETDSLVQKTIREAFSDCTMFIIAHRLNTVLHCDRILVMEDGKVAECDKPSVLLANPSSKFKAMLDATEGNRGIS
ncbi:hypothetical protein ScPMuIL_018262 [Solemya velum]